MITAGSTFTSSTIPISYNITYTPASLSSAQAAGIGIVGYTTLQTLDFSMNASITSFGASYIHITARALDTTIVSFMAVHYIAVGGQNYFVDVRYSCKTCVNIGFLPTVLNTGNGTRS